MMKKIALAVVLSTTALSAMAEESKDFYAQVNAGYALGMESKGSNKDLTTSKKFKTGKSFSIGLEGGAQINEYLRAGLSFDYMPNFKVNFSSMNSSVTKVTPTAPTPSTDYFVGTIDQSVNDPKVKSMNLMANLFVDAGNFSGFKPYAVVGLGFARNKASNVDIKQVINGNNESYGASSNLTGVTAVKTSKTETYSGKTKNNFAFKVGLGMKYAINEDFDVDVRYQYMNLGKAQFGSGTVKVIANELMLGVAYKF